MNFRSIFRPLSCCLVAMPMLLPLQAANAGDVASAVSINDPYIRAVPPVVTTTAAFMQVQNSDAVVHAIVSASTPLAGTVELHTHEHDNGVMRMRQVPRIELPPAETVVLEPDGLHVMLFDLKSTLSPGDEVPLTLVFDDGSSKQVKATVRHVEGMMMKHH